MNLKQIIFPVESRTLWGKRWLNVVFRSIHLCGISIYTGGFFFGIPHEHLMTSYAVTAASGLAIILMDLYSNGKWIFQNRGFFLVVKLVLLGFIPHLPDYQVWALLGIVILSSVVSHATGNFRYYSLYHRKKI